MAAYLGRGRVHAQKLAGQAEHLAVGERHLEYLGALVQNDLGGLRMGHRRGLPRWRERRFDTIAIITERRRPHWWGAGISTCNGTVTVLSYAASDATCAQENIVTATVLVVE